VNSLKQNRPPKYSGILWLQVTTLPVTKYPPVPFSPFLLLFVFRPITNLPRKDRKGKSEAKYTVRQSSNEPRKIPHITSHHKKRSSLHSSSSANHSADSRGVAEKVRRRETRANNLHRTSLSSLLESGTTGSSLGTHRLLGTRISHRKNRTVSRFSAARRNLLTPHKFPLNSP
jgi:hypothetical protein